MSSTLKETAVKGMAWAIGERLLTQGSLFIISLVLARILSPKDYGMLSLLLVFINLADVLVTNGLGEALIQRRDPSRFDYGTVFVCGLVLSLCLYAALFFASDAIAIFYRMESMGHYLRILALRIPFSSLNAIQKAYISKRFLFKKQFFVSSVSSIMSGVIAIVMAMGGLGIYALIAQQLMNVVLTSAIMIIQTKWAPSFCFSRKSFSELVPLGAQYCGASLINSIYLEGRSLVIGRFYSAADLAYFNRGNQFPSLIIGNLNAPISNVMLPVLSEVNADRQRVKSVLRKSIQLSSFLVLPMMGMLAACGSALVSILLTDKWADCVPYLQLGCIFYLFQPLQTMNWQALKALGKGELCLRLEVVKKVTCFVLLGISIPFGVFAIAVSSAASGFFSMAVNIAPMKKLLGYGFREQMLDIAKPAGVTVVSYAAMTIVEALGLSTIGTLAIQVLVGSVVYLIGSALLKLEGFSIVVGEICALRVRNKAE